MAERAVDVREQRLPSQFSNCTALHVPLDEFGSIPPAATIRLLAAFSIYFIRTLRYFCVAIQDLADGPDGLTLRHGFCAATRMEMALRVIEDLDTEFAARERVPLPDEPITAVSSFP